MSNKEAMKAILQEAKRKLELNSAKEEYEQDLIDLRLSSIREISTAKLEAENALLKTLVAERAPLSTTPAVGHGAGVVERREAVVTPMFSEVVRGFLDSFARGKKAAMCSKYRAVLPMLLEVVGDKQVADLKQADINRFFEIVQRLPPRWADQCRRRQISLTELAALDHPVCMGPKTFEDTYKACVRAFLKGATKDWQDQGFPATLTTAGTEYAGSRKEGENKQRALTKGELKRLFEGAEMREFANDPEMIHQYWLPHIGLFTGARVNEICQLNPQTDIRTDEETGIWFFNFTEDTESDDRVKKSIKTKVMRKIPIHPVLLDLGFIKYVERIISSGAKLIFPPWEPRRGRAGPIPARWFTGFLKSIGLHGVKNELGMALRGTHAFRHTLLTYGKLAGLNLRCITGHVQKSDNPEADGYEDDAILLPLTEKKRLLDQLRYEIRFIQPA